MKSLSKTIANCEKTPAPLHQQKCLSVGSHACGRVAIGISAHGIVAIGVCAHGVVSVGVIAMGVFSVGLVSMGLVSTGLVAMGIASFDQKKLEVVQPHPQLTDYSQQYTIPSSGHHH